MTEVSTLLKSGDQDNLDEVIPLVYQELKKLAKAHLRREAGVVHLQTTALVHEVFLKLAANRHHSYQNRSHFYGITSRLMRQILVDMARSRDAEKRGVGWEIALEKVPDFIPPPNRPVLALEDALQRLEQTDHRKAKLIEMYYFGGMTGEETSTALSLPIHVVRRELRLAQAWLRKEMAGATATPVQT